MSSNSNLVVTEASASKAVIVDNSGGVEVYRFDEGGLEIGGPDSLQNVFGINASTGVIEFSLATTFLDTITCSQAIEVTSASPHVILQNSGLTVGVDQVVGAQQPAIADAAVTLIDVIAKFNTLLAALRTHGLIDT